MKWIDASDLKNWANTKQRHCQATLPELVRRLILAHTANAVEEFDFPAGDSISAEGWDGRLRTAGASPFFPSGFSGWEFGADKSAQSKAEADFTKRTADPLGLPTQDTTFVFVTPRSWPKHEVWQNSKRALGCWKDVRIINAEGLEQWLASTPAVALWLARQIGKVISGAVRDLEAFWEEWSVGTKPSMTPDLVVSGRTQDVAKIHEWLAGSPAILEVQGDHPDEAFAFMFASMASLSFMDSERALARCVLVENVNEFRQVSQGFQNFPLIIAAPGECVDAASAAILKGHHVFLSIGGGVTGVRDVFRLSRPQGPIVEKLLHGAGLPEADAQRISRDFGRSIPILRRQLSSSNAVRAPAWARAESAPLLIPVLLAGAWHEGEVGDCQVIETLSSTSHEEFVRRLMPFLSMDDSPIRKVGSVWMIKSALDTWFLLARYLTDELLKNFGQSLVAVLTKTDPRYELSAEQRWAAALYGKSNPYSELLRIGLVESLVLVAVYGNRYPTLGSAQAFANHIVTEVFASADKWEAWASLQRETPLLAEAAPDAFMEMVDEGVAKHPTLFKELMQSTAGLFDECRHAGLLWALEGLAWSPEYFARAVDILAKLAAIDPGGNWSNRPIGSLSDVFLPRFPQTYATADERLAVLDTLIAQYPQMVWKLGCRYFGQGMISESHRFRWREAGGTRRGLEQEESGNLRKYAVGLFPRLSNLAAASENLVSATEEFTRLPDEVQQRVLGELEKIEPTAFSGNERAQLLAGVRDALNWLNTHGEDDGKRKVPVLNRVLQRFTPQDVIERVGWLLATPWPHMPEGDPEDYEERTKRVRTSQEQAAREMLDNAPLARILDFAKTVECPGLFSYTIGKAIRDAKEDAVVLDALLEHLDRPLLLRSYAQGRVETEGPTWTETQITRMEAKGNCSAEACALLHLGLPECATTWSAVAERGKDVEDAYWKQASGYSRTGKEDAPIAVRKLLDAQRPDAALEIAGDPHVSIPSELLQRLLEDLLKTTTQKFRAGVMEEFHLGHVFKQLYEQNQLSLEELAKLEWPFGEFFDDLRPHTSAPMALHRLLQKDPRFFAQLITILYKRDDRAPDPTRAEVDPAAASNRAHVARAVMDSWHLMPGLKDDGALDERELAEWVKVARDSCEETNHITGGDLQIAFMLARAPADPNDGAWPHVAVRNLLEDLNNGRIDRHIQIGLYNSRGVVTRSLGEGGRQERELAERYKKMSDKARTRWPRTAALLRSMAESYEHEARQEDIDSDLLDLRWI